MAFFTKKTWVARQGTGLNKFSINGATPVTVVNQPDSVTEQGDALSATNLNNLEQRIYNAFLDVDGVFDNIEDGIVLVGRAKADQNGDIIDETYAKQNGYYAELGAGTAEQLVSTQTVDDDDAYLFRTSGGSVDIGNRETDEIVGGTLGLNQLIPLVSSTSSHGVTVTNNNDGSYTLDTNGQATDGITWIYFTSIANSKDKIFLTSLAPSATSGVYLMDGNTGVYYGYTSYVFKSGQSTTTVHLRIDSGKTLDHIVVRPQIFDLTAMFGAEIADYILALEQSTAGAGVAWFRRYFPKPYYPYNAGGLSSVKPSSHDMTGFNQWDEEWELGYITNGANVSGSGDIRSKNYIKVLPNTEYYIHSASGGCNLAFYDANKNWISPQTTKQNTTFITPPNCHYMRFYAVGQTTYKGDICINLSWSGTRNGEYEPFELHSYPLDDSTEYRGIPKLDADGNLYFEGDIYKSSGDVTRKYKQVTLNGNNDPAKMGSTYDWEDSYGQTNTYGIRIFSVSQTDAKPSGENRNNFGNSFLDRASSISTEGCGTNSSSSKVIFVAVLASRLSSVDVAGFKTWLASNPIQFLYELATPTQESVNPFTNPQIVNDWGTEEYVDTRDMPIPVGHNTQYMANLRDKLQHLPNLANGDGEYVVKQTGTQMELVKTDNLKKDGYYPTLAVGTADNLRGKGTVGANFTFRTSGGSADIGSGSARLDRINGNTLMLNQKVKNGNFGTGDITDWYSQHVTTSVTNGVLKMDGSEAGVREVNQNLNAIQGHKYAIFGTISGNVGYSLALFHNSAWLFMQRNNGTTQKIAHIVQATTTGYLYLEYRNIENQYDDGTSAYLSNVMLIDLTQMFGSGNEPTVDEFKALFPLDYYDYTEGTPLNFKGTGLKTDGFNQWDEQWESGQYSNTTGEKVSNANYGRSKNYIPVIPSQYYYFKIPTSYGQVMYYAEYDANKNFLRYGAGLNTIVQVGSDCHFITIWMYGWTSYNNDVCINLSWSGIRNGEYEPYWDSTLDLPITTIKGKASGSDESVVIFPDGMKAVPSAKDELNARKGIVRTKLVCLGDYTWTKNTQNGYFYCTLGDNFMDDSDYKVHARISLPLDYVWVADSNMTDKSYRVVNTVRIKDSAYTSLTADQFKTAMANVYLVYELATPVEYTLDEELNLNYRVDDFGTEQLLPENTSTPTTSPLVAEIAYAMNAVDTLRNLDKNFTNLATLDALIAIINSKCGVTITRGSFDSANNRYTFS